MLVSNPFLSTMYQFRQAVMQDYRMKFLKFKSDVHFLSSMLPSKLEPYRYFINSDGYLLKAHFQPWCNAVVCFFFGTTAFV